MNFLNSHRFEKGQKIGRQSGGRQKSQSIRRDDFLPFENLCGLVEMKYRYQRIFSGNTIVQTCRECSPAGNMSVQTCRKCSPAGNVSVQTCRECSPAGNVSVQTCRECSPARNVSVQTCRECSPAGNVSVQTCRKVFPTINELIKYKHNKI
jgi:ribosomal protein L40E